MKGWGGTFLFLGIGSFILPMFGLQFRILNLFGSLQPIISVVCIVMGIGLLVADKMNAR